MKETKEMALESVIAVQNYESRGTGTTFSTLRQPSTIFNNLTDPLIYECLSNMSSI